MKNTAMAREASERDDAGWCDELRLFESDLRRRGAADRTLRAYGAEVRRLAAWAIEQRVRPEAVDMPVLRRYAAAIAAARPEPGGAARNLAAVRAFLLVLREHGLLAPAPVGGSGPARPRPAALDDLPAATPLQVRDRAIFALVAAGGLTAHELVGLDVGSIALGDDHVRVTGRAGRTRRIALDQAGRQALERYLERARPALAAGDGETALLLSKSGRRLSTGDVRRRLRSSEHQAAIRGATAPHALRHGFAAHLLEGRADVRAIQELLGQASVSTTLTDTRVDSARLRTAYARSHPRA